VVVAAQLQCLQVLRALAGLLVAAPFHSSTLAHHSSHIQSSLHCHIQGRRQALKGQSPALVHMKGNQGHHTSMVQTSRTFLCFDNNCLGVRNLSGALGFSQVIHQLRLGLGLVTMFNPVTDNLLGLGQ